jgi:DNA-binding SARP family transcriptional activator
MSITIQLLGRPRITRGSAAGYKFRSRKSWGLLAYLILSERPAARSQLASLLFAEADDPVRALRWCLAEADALEDALVSERAEGRAAFDQPCQSTSVTPFLALPAGSVGV